MSCASTRASGNDRSFPIAISTVIIALSTNASRDCPENRVKPNEDVNTSYSRFPPCKGTTAVPAYFSIISLRPPYLCGNSTCSFSNSMASSLFNALRFFTLRTRSPYFLNSSRKHTSSLISFSRSAWLFGILQPPLTISRNCWNRYTLSRGPGEASEWYWIENMGSSRCLSPSTVWSFRFIWLTSRPSLKPSASTA